MTRVELGVAISLVSLFALLEEQWNWPTLSSRDKETNNREKENPRGNTDVPRSPRGIGSRMHQGYQILRMLKSHSGALSIR